MAYFTARSGVLGPRYPVSDTKRTGLRPVVSPRVAFQQRLAALGAADLRVDPVAGELQNPRLENALSPALQLLSKRPAQQPVASKPGPGASLTTSVTLQRAQSFDEAVPLNEQIRATVRTLPPADGGANLPMVDQPLPQIRTFNAPTPTFGTEQVDPAAAPPPAASGSGTPVDVAPAPPMEIVQGAAEAGEGLVAWANRHKGVLALAGMALLSGGALMYLSTKK